MKRVLAGSREEEPTSEREVSNGTYRSSTIQQVKLLTQAMISCGSMISSHVLPSVFIFFTIFIPSVTALLFPCDILQE